jgi:hypothetical protein
VVDALATILREGSEAVLIKGLLLDLVEGGLTHLQYVDGTMIFLEAEVQYIANVKFLLYCFENMSGLKINLRVDESLRRMG